MKENEQKNIAFFLFAFVAGAGFCSGCALVGLLGTPTSHEEKIHAEYDLTNQENKKILVLVNQPAWLLPRANLRYHLTEAVNAQLTRKTKIPSEYLASYGQLSEFRANRTDFSSLSGVEVGAGLGADMVLLVTIEDCVLQPLGDEQYYKAALSARTALFDVAGRARLWPSSADGKNIRVGFEVESRGREVAVARLTSTAAYCIVRYFYDCPKDQFKIVDEMPDVAW
ncbi:MAG: hypothetical protein ACYTBJ_05115 [Planctomycetota bacterium]|jgi:hypothetical protein